MKRFKVFRQTFEIRVVSSAEETITARHRFISRNVELEKVFSVYLVQTVFLILVFLAKQRILMKCFKA